MNLRYFFSGWARLCADGACATAILNLCMRYRLVYSHRRTDPRTGEVHFDMSASCAGLLCRRCAEQGIPVRVLRRGGLPHLLMQYRHRVGLVIGAALGLAILLASGRVLWDIRVSGNETLTTRQVLQELEASGLHVGMPLSELDSNQAEIQIQLDSDLISWVSINMAGTVANVEIRERVPTPEDAPLQPANLVARCEGVIEGLEVYTGNTVVQVGQGVQEGDLLVSGVFDSQAVGWRVTRASGRVLARTVHEFSIEIPLNYEQKVYVGDPITQKTLIFFEKEIKLFKNTGISGTGCDKISNVDSFTFREGVGLPIALRSETYLPYETRPAIRDYAQAQVLAYAELARVLARDLPEADLLRKSLSAELTDEAYILHCTVTCLEDIARVQEFSVTELTDG